MPEANLNKDFFISYTSIDQPWAEWIAAELEHAGYTTIIQAWDFRPGSNFVVEIDNATKIAKRIIALLSPKYFDSGYTSSEWATAFRYDPKGEQGSLLPIRVQSCDVEGLLGPIIYIDLVSLDEKTARQRLLEGVRRERIKPQSVPFPLVQATASAHSSFPRALPLIWNIPYPRNPYFTGHEELLKQLATTLRTAQTSVLPKPLAISGLGGMGKTQLALEYAYQYHQDYQAVFWAQADSREALLIGFATMAELLNLPEKDTQDQMKVVIAVQQWLRVQTKWLLILNNADDLKIISDFIPPTVSGHLILTTRVRVIGHLAQRIEISGLNPEQGALLLLRRSGLIPPNALIENSSYEDAKTAEEIAEEMGGLPLAIDQAGAYIEEVSCTLLEYKYLY